ncbi:MAG: hypothetical protein KGR48_16535 [Alphaproteobacteria bacterium]|nr:hypothetical protein [Alphaproteobacteria bacterium]MDE2013603.1 hypothetical protein [Alphaproteobacteria bacterium]MDE2074244.1 hypothetical protein [Alphaproteobacteria bacterium]MDE2352983.1 hypothetical protein [Alphaproteobacteria bacterium]
MNPRPPLEHVVVREARRVFRRLRTSGAYLAPDGGRFVLMVNARAKRSVLWVEAYLVMEFLRRDWLRPRSFTPGSMPETYCLSDAGEGWYLRAVAEAEPFAAQHQLRRQVLIETAEGERSVIVNEGESPLGWLRQRRHIDAAQFEAGERLRRDFTIAQLTPRLGVDLTAPIVLGRRGLKGEAPLSDAVLAAKARVRAALAAVGPGLADMLFDVCCHLSGLAEVERAHDWPRRSAKVVLDIALDRLALHYGLRMRAPARARMRGWQAEPPVESGR